MLPASPEMPPPIAPHRDDPDRTGAPSDRRRILHLVFVVDASGSMAGERINALNWAARAAVPAMRDAATDHPDVDVLVRVIRFSDGVDWPVRAPVPVGDFVWPTIMAGGETRMGEALIALAEALASPDLDPERCLPPVVVLLSDGLPTDDAEAGIAALARTELGRRAIRIPIAIGSDADLELLQDFAGDPALRPLRATNAERLVSHIRWAASVPVEAATMPPGPETTSGLAEDADKENEAQGGLVW